MISLDFHAPWKTFPAPIIFAPLFGSSIYLVSPSPTNSYFDNLLMILTLNFCQTSSTLSYWIDAYKSIYAKFGQIWSTLYCLRHVACPFVTQTLKIVNIRCDQNVFDYMQRYFKLADGGGWLVSPYSKNLDFLTKFYWSFSLKSRQLMILIMNSKSNS